MSPQQAFQHELLNHLAAQDMGGERDLGTTTSAATDVLQAASPIGEMTPGDRWNLMRELIRVATAANLDAVTISPLWQAWIGVVGAAASRNLDADDEFHQAIWLGEERATTRYVGLYQTMAVTFGIRLRTHTRPALRYRVSCTHGGSGDPRPGQCVRASHRPPHRCGRSRPGVDAVRGGDGRPRAAVLRGRSRQPPSHGDTPARRLTSRMLSGREPSRAPRSGTRQLCADMCCVVVTDGADGDRRLLLLVQSRIAAPEARAALKLKCLNPASRAAATSSPTAAASCPVNV